MSLHLHLEQLSIVRERVSLLNSRARELADAFNGSEPMDKPEGSAARISSTTINNQFGEVISNIQDDVAALGHHIERLEQQVLAGAPSTLGTATRMGY